MTFILLLSILLISTFCQSYKLNLHNRGNEKKTFSALKTLETTRTPPLRETSKNYNFKQTIKNITPMISSWRPLVAQTSIQGLNSTFLDHTQPYTAGAVSNILSGPPSAPVVANQYGSYQTHINFDNPTTAKIFESVTAASVQGETFHPNKQSSQESKSLKKHPSRAVALVRSAPLYAEIYHQPQNESKEKANTTSLPKFQYNHSVVHNHEPNETLNFPFKRKQRNLNENSKEFEEKVKESKKDTNSNETEYSTENDSDDKAKPSTYDDADEDETMESISESKEHPLDYHEMRYYHDIFLNYPQPHHANYGHIEYSPELFEKRFESSQKGNRYKGEIIWHDDKGGFAQHQWDMALGKL